MKNQVKILLLVTLISQSANLHARGKVRGGNRSSSPQGQQSRTSQDQPSASEDSDEEVVVENVCSSDSYCVHGNMPLYSQANSDFLSLIGQSKDLGFCGAGASAMIFKTYISNQESLNSSDVSEVLSSSSKGQIIYQSGVLVGTNFTSGGTSTRGIQNGFKSFLNNVSNSTSNLVSSSSISSSSDALSVTDFQVLKPLVLLGLTVGNIGHAVAWNGYQTASTFVLYDPWKRIYNVQVNGTSLSHPSGYGFVKAYSSSGTIKVSKVVGLK